MGIIIFYENKNKQKWAKYTAPWLVTERLEIRLQRSRSKKDSRRRLLEEQIRDFNMKGELSRLIQMIEERRDQMPVPERRSLTIRNERSNPHQIEVETPVVCSHTGVSQLSGVVVF